MSEWETDKSAYWSGPGPMSRAIADAIEGKEEKVKPAKELFISVDVEADGPAPGINSMIQLGAYAFMEDHGDFEELGTFNAALKPLDGAKVDVDTLVWWQGDADRKRRYENLLNMGIDPFIAIKDFDVWLVERRAIARRLDAAGDDFYYNFIFCASPTGFDFTYVYWYMHEFLHYCPFTHRALDLRSMIKGLTGRPYHDCHKSDYAVGIVNDNPHDALADACEQALVFQNVLRATKKFKE